MRQIKITVLLCTLLFALIGCQSSDEHRHKISDFTFTDHNDNLFGTDDLTGNVWIANFIFTNCQTVCQPMTAEMATLQTLLKEQQLPVQFVSFTVDPENDSPEVLKDYIADFTNDTSNWHLLTGYSQEEIERFAREQFQTIVQKPTTSTQVLHGTNFYLMNQNGQVIGEYNFISPQFHQSIIQDVKKSLK